ARLEDLTRGASVKGILPDCLVTVVSVQWFGSEALELTYKNPTGRVANELLYRHDEARLEVVEQGRPWSFDSDGYLFRLAFHPEAISQSLRHRRERLEKRCHELELLQRGAAARVMATVIPTLDAEDV